MFFFFTRMMHRKSADLLVVLAEKLWGRAGISQEKKIPFVPMLSSFSIISIVSIPF